MVDLHLGYSTTQGGISLGTGKVQLLLNKHKNTNGIGMEASTPEGDCVATT
jgi:hypothetical protein